MPGIPVPKPDHAEPFQRAMFADATPPIDGKVPTAITPPAVGTRASTQALLPAAPPPSDCHEPFQRAIALVPATLPALVKRPPATTPPFGRPATAFTWGTPMNGGT